MDNNTPERATFAVNVHEEFWAHPPRCKCLHRACGAEGTRIHNTEDGYGNDGVENRGKTAHTSQLDCKHEGGSLGVGAGRTEEVGVIGRKNQADHEERDDVETCDAPKHLLGGGWEGLSRVSGLSGGKTDKLGPTESESRVDKDGAKSFEAVFECAWIMPVVSPQVPSVDFAVDTSAVHNDGENDETDDCCDFDNAENKLDC